MPKTANTHTLSNYPKLGINGYRNQLRITKPDSLEVSYRYRGKLYRYNIELLTTGCNYGGSRYWWSCPQCSKRVGVLYCAGIYVCRHCLGANYETQLQQPWQRPDNRLQAIRNQLGWTDKSYQGKKKGMHRARYKRLLIEYITIEDYYLDQISAVDKMVNRRC